MQVIKSLWEIPKEIHGGSAAIGNFDGVHLGHRMIFSRLLELKRERGLPALAITFEPHTKRVLHPTKVPFYLLTTLEEKLALFSQAGLDATVVIPFDENFAALTAEDFVESVLCDKLRISSLLIGHDYAFGKGKGGGIKLLENFARAGAFALEVFAAYKTAQGDIISSTAVREAILRGDVRAASRMLGRFYEIKGEVEHGVGRGAQLGFPTANITPNKELLPPRGVYATLVSIEEPQSGALAKNGRKFSGALNIGFNPTFGGQALSLEVFISGYEGNLYGRNIVLEFVERIRGEVAFSSATELAAQIKADVAKIQVLTNEFIR